MLQPEISGEGFASDKQAASLLSFAQSFFSKFAKPAAEKDLKANEPVKRRFPKPAGYKKYTYADVAQHTTQDDAWVIVDGKVYDISAMPHPGGDVVFSYAGRDATEVFAMLHKDHAKVRAVLKAYLIGELASVDQSALLKDFNEMVDGFRQKGYFTASKLYYGRKLLELAAMAGTSLYILFNHANNFTLVAFACLLQAMFFFQCGWAQHDFNHNQVFTSHKLNSIFGCIVVNLGMGGSEHWWKTKHNQHHATPNKMTHDDTEAVDPDIDTVPIIAWNESLLKQVSRGDRALISMQHILVWPLLCVAYINWQIQSIIHVLFFPTVSAQRRKFELAAIIAHHLWTCVGVFYNLGFVNGLAFWLISHFISGFGTGYVFIQSHNGMEIYTDDKDFVTSQFVSTRNIDPSVVGDWLMGGLNYQIEHHLFPTMPRNNYSVVRKQVMELCAKHGLPYETCGILESSRRVYVQLAKIARLA